MVIEDFKAGGGSVMRRLLYGIVAARVALAVFTAAWAEDWPILQLDTGGHMAVIRGLAFTPDGKFIVSASDDKVIRVWDWRVGKTVRTIRRQSGPGQEGTSTPWHYRPMAAGSWRGGYYGNAQAKRGIYASMTSPAAS